MQRTFFLLHGYYNMRARPPKRTYIDTYYHYYELAQRNLPASQREVGIHTHLLGRAAVHFLEDSFGAYYLLIAVTAYIIATPGRRVDMRRGRASLRLDTLKVIRMFLAGI